CDWFANSKVSTTTTAPHMSLAGDAPKGRAVEPPENGKIGFDGSCALFDGVSGNRGRIRFRQLLRRGVDRALAARAVFGGRGPWFNARCPPMIQAVPTAELRRLGLASLVESQAAFA